MVLFSVHSIDTLLVIFDGDHVGLVGNCFCRHHLGSVERVGASSLVVNPEINLSLQTRGEDIDRVGASAVGTY